MTFASNSNGGSRIKTQSNTPINPLLTSANDIEKINIEVSLDVIATI